MNQSPLYRTDNAYDELFERLVESKPDVQSEVMRSMCLNDLYFFAKYILGFWWLCWEPHKEFSLEIEKDINRSLFLLPRGHCKTYIFTIADSIRHYLRTPRTPIAIFCDQQKRARKKLRPVRNILEKNPTLKKLFPDMLYQNPVRESSKWNDDELILPGWEGTQEASISAYGVENQPTGLHFRRIKCDDLVTVESATTFEQLTKTKDLYGIMAGSILSPGGNIGIAGTIYDDCDLHRDMEDSKQYRVYKRPAEWTETDEDGVIHKRTLWPVQYGIKALQDIRSDPTMTHYIYSCQYLQDPAPDDANSFFQLSWFPRWSKLPLGMRYYAAADLAISEKETACETAIPVFGLDYNNRMYLVDVRHGHWGSKSIVGNLISVQAQHGIDIFGIEAENIQRTIKPYLEDEMYETGVFLNPRYFRPEGDKVAKARGLQGRAEAGSVYLPEKDYDLYPWLSAVEYQLGKFPRSAKKDIVDSMSLVCHILNEFAKPRPLTEIARSRSADNYVSLER